LFVIPDDLPIELTPFTFLLGHWSGSGVVSYPVKGKDPVEVEFFQEMQFLPLPNGKLEYQAISRQADGSVISQEHGFWMLAKNTLDHEPGPGLLPGKAESTIQSREQLEEFRNATGGFDIEVSSLASSWKSFVMPPVALTLRRSSQTLTRFQSFISGRSKRHEWTLQPMRCCALHTPKNIQQGKECMA